MFLCCVVNPFTNFIKTWLKYFRRNDKDMLNKITMYYRYF
jgi:hypothetical protein